MRIIIVGANGAVGKTALTALSSRHEIISVGRTRGDIQADIEDIGSIRTMYRQIDKVDAVICTAGGAHFAAVNELTSEQFLRGFARKVLPQVNLVIEGFKYINDGGSFTLTSGVSNREPVSGGSAAAAANGALDGFVIGAAVDMPRGIRINAVSPDALEVSREKHPQRFYGHRHVSNEAVGLAYSKAVESSLNGQIFIVE